MYPFQFFNPNCMTNPYLQQTINNNGLNTYHYNANYNNFTKPFNYQYFTFNPNKFVQSQFFGGANIFKNE